MTNQQGSPLVLQANQSPIGLLTGATYPFRALAVLQRSPQLWGYVLVPILVNSVVWLALYVSLLLPGWQWISALITTLPAWAAFLGVLLHGLLIAGLLLLTGFLLLQFGGLLGAPWYGQLAEQLEQRNLGHLPAKESLNLATIGRDIGRSLQFELKKLLLVIGIGLPLLLLNLLPGAGTLLATVGGIALTTTIICLDFFDPALERRRLSFRAKLGFIFKTLPASASFGLVCLGLISIPFLNLLTIPLCVTAGTLFFCDRLVPKSSSTSPAEETE